MNSKIKIYQLYYKDEQVPFLEPAFTPFDNRSNLYPNEREYPLLKQCRDLAVNDNVELWGGVSWNYVEKYNTDPNYIFSWIERNPGYDVYFVDPYTTQSPIIYNVWEQGQWCHPYIIDITEELFQIAGQDLSILYQPMDRKTIIWGSSCIAGKSFWDEYFKFADNILSGISLLSPGTKIKYESPCYTDTSINYFSFIQERLMSTFIHINRKKYKILPFHCNEDLFIADDPEILKLTHLKTLALERGDSSLLEYWRNLRKRLWKYFYNEPNLIDWAEKWIPLYNTKL